MRPGLVGKNLNEGLSKLLVLFFLTLWLCPVAFILADEKTVVVNEIAWMGTKEQWQNEWIELYNPTDSPVSLDGWVLKSKSDSPKIELSGNIGAGSYFLLERTDDTTLPDITADQIYKGGLNNQGEYLVLLNKSGKTVDEIDCFLGWFAGSNETKKTMERLDPSSPGSDPDNWKNSQKTGGTPRAKNSPKKEIKKEKKLGIVSNTFNSSAFSSALAIGIALSLFLSMLILAFWLKIKQKKDKIKQTY